MKSAPKSRKPPKVAADLNEQIVSCLTSAVLAVDGRGRVLTANHAAALNLNIPQEQLLTGTDLAGLPEAQALLELLEEMRETASPISRREIGLSTPEGQRILGVTASLLEGEDDFNGAIFLFTDLTRIRHLERTAELNRQLAQIGALTAGVVHELRNPLSVITGMTELLARKLGKESELSRYSDMVLQECEQLDKLISHFLNFAKPFELELASVPVKEIISRTMKLVERTAEQKSVGVRLDAPQALPKMSADLTKACQALSNMLRNAVEVSPAGSEVIFRVEVENASAIFFIEDSGPGIHLQEGDDLFTPFFTKKEGGTGLGLSIAHRIITAHGGEAAYGNNPGGGAWFRVRLPLKQEKH